VYTLTRTYTRVLLRDSLIALRKNIYIRPIVESIGPRLNPRRLPRRYGYGYNGRRSTTTRWTITIPTYNASGA
jgi:hypothetical protein